MHECDNPLFYLQILLQRSFFLGGKGQKKEYVEFLAQKVVAVIYEIYVVVT